MVGRGLRIHPGKKDCLVLDFGGNVARHGTIDRLKIRAKDVGGEDGEAPTKACPECNEMVHAGLLACSVCGYEFPPREPSHEATASGDAVLSETTEDWVEVTNVIYGRHNKKNAPDAPPTLRVMYYSGPQSLADEWICVEHSGFAWEKAYSWWFRRSGNPMPKTVDEAVKLGDLGALIAPTRIKLRYTTGERFPKIVGYELEDKPEEPVAVPVIDLDEVPF
jgi:DNA repair protein RadD